MTFYGTKLESTLLGFPVFTVSTYLFRDPDKRNKHMELMREQMSKVDLTMKITPIEFTLEENDQNETLSSIPILFLLSK